MTIQKIFINKIVEILNLAFYNNLVVMEMTTDNETEWDCSSVG